MAQQDDNIKKLYDELQSTYDVGSEDDFRNYLNNAEHRKALYNELKNDYDIQDEKAFDDYLGYINGEKALGTTKVGSVAQQVVNEYDQSAKDNAEAEEDLSAATSGAKIGGNISFAPAKPNNQQTVQPDVDNTAKSVMDASGTPVEQAKVTGPKTQFVSEDPNYVSGTPKEEALKKYPWMQPDQVYLWNKTTKEPVVTYVDESGHAVTDEDLQIKKAKSEITGQEDTEYMHPEAAALQLPNGNTRGVRLKKGALTQMADEIMRKEYGDNYLNTQFGRDGNVYTGAERRDLGAQQLYDELNSDVRKARISFAVADDKDRNEILSRIKAKWGKVADETSLVNAVNDENAAKQDIDIVAQQNINDLNAEIQNISRQMDQRGAEIDNASSPFVDQTFNARDVDAKYRLLQSKLNYAQNALKSWENVKNSGSLDALAGFKDAVMDISAWDFGFSDLKNSIALLTAKGNDKQELVNLYGKSSEATKFEDKYNPDSYRYGKIAGASIPFALQFVGTGGGFKSIGSAVSKKATSIAEKYALEGLKKQVVKGLGVAVGDIARAYTMSGTVQGLNTISDILTRSAGELTVDKQGNYQLKSDEPLLKSIYKGVTASAIENYTEMLGERLNIGGNLMRMLPKIGLGRVSNAITKIGTQDWYRVCNNWLSRAGVNDFGGEVLEEEIGIILNAALVGDNPLFNGSGGLLDVRTQKDILGGMLYSISAMRAGALAMYGVKKGVGSAFIKTLDMYDKMQLNQSDKGGQSIFGEGWAAIKDEIDNTPNEKVNAVIEKLAKEHPSKDEQSAIIDYAVKLLKTRGHNLGIAMASDGENDEGAQEEVQDMPDLSQPNAEYFNKDDGMIHKASLYPDASDPTGTAKDVFIIKGNLVTNEDGSINKDASDDTIIYIDGNGERHIASPDKFAAAYPPMSNNEVLQANEGGENEEAQTTTFNKGDEVNINVDGNNYTATIQGTDGFGNYNVYYEDEIGMMHPAKFTADQLNEMNGKSTVSNGQQATSEQPADVQQQVEQPVVEQPAQQEQETQLAQPAQEEQKPAIPTDEKGNMLYHQVPVETTINDLYDGSLDDNEIRDFVDANISEADKNLEKVNKKAPKIGTNKAEYLKKKQEWQKQVEDATRIRDYWNGVKDYIAQQTHTTPEEVNAAQDELSGEAARREYQDMGGSVQQDAVSVASDFIRGAKITPESFKAETGYGTDEQRKFVGMIAKAEKGGKTIDRLAEELVSYDNAEMNGVLFGGDTSSAKDAILSALQGAGTRGELKQTNEAEEQAYIDARNAARDEQYMEQYGMTYEEYLAYEEQIMPTIWREYNNYDEVAFNNMYAEEIEQLIKSRENDTTGEEQADDRGNQVLSEQQVTEQRGSADGTEPGTEVQVGVQGIDENAAAPEEAQQQAVAQKIATAEAETDTNPTEGQKEAGNYKKGHVRIDGYDITIEQPKGSVRRGTDADGKQWEQTMNNTYGYIRGTEGVDGDHIDIFLSDNPTEGNVYVVDQVNPDGSFDEHKVMYGFQSAEDARAAYLSNYEEGWQGLGTITEVSKEEFKKWVNSSKRKTKPFAEYKSVNAIGAQNEERNDLYREADTEEEINSIIDNAKADGTYMKAPNGNPTNLNERQWAQVRTKAFKDWFGDWENDSENASKVVDENGEPKVVYHGSRSKSRINVFKEVYEKGTFFSTSKNVGSIYSSNNPDNLYSAFINAKNPLIVDNKGKDWNKIDAEDLIEAAEKMFNITKEEFLESLGEDRYITTDGIVAVISRLSEENKSPYDGLILKNVIETNDNEIATDVVAIKSNQIKSATDNTGAFSPENNDIRYRFIGETGARNLDAAEEATTRLDNLSVAREMEDAGKDAKTIKIATGWERGADGKWRYETEDFEFKEKPIVADFDGYSLTTLDSLINDDELFKAYPQLSDILVQYQNLPSAMLGSYSSKTSISPAMITLSHEFKERKENPEWRKKVAEMEKEPVIKSWIDAMDREPFDMQAYEEAERNFKSSPLWDEYNNLLKGQGDIPRYVPGFSGKQVLAHEIQHAIQDIEGFSSGANTKNKQYKESAGEVEARNVEARINMTPEERRQSLASETEDVAREDQLFIYDNLGVNARQGVGALTDSKLSNANDPAGKMLGKPSRTPAQQKAFAERERQRMADRAREVADILHLDNVEIVTDASTLQGRRAKAKGFYSRDNGKIVIVVPNHVDMADIEQTVLHEAVAHYGLRKLFGSNFDTFLYNVYNNADMDVREKISQLAAQHNWNFATATEEYLASLAEKTNFENLNASWWDKIKSLFLKLLHSIGLKGFTGVSLSDNELRYILWRSYENLKNPGRYRSIIDEAKDITMQNELRVGNYSAGNSEAVGKAAENGVVNIEDVNRRFNEELGRLTEENAQSVILNLGRPGNFLLASGLSDRPIKLYGNKLLKKMRKHGFTTSDVKNLPKEINNPIAVFKGSVENSFAILTELEINGNNVLASISVGKGNDIDFNIISSVYGKNGNSVVSWINDGKILYVNKEKALNYLRISAPIAEAQDNQELSSAANIVKNFENPNISEENMRYGNGALAASESNGINKTNETNGQEAEEANRRFNEELNAFKAKTHKGLLHLGQPGRILNACGINEELTLSPTVLSRKLKQHGLNVDDIKGLAGAIQEPILVYQHGDAHPNMVIVTDLAAKGGKVSVAVELDGEGNVVELNNVSSVHSKGATTELERLSNMRDGYLEQALRWVDKNKVSDWLGIADLNSPIHANNPKLVSIANILQNFENPSVGEENILYREAKKVEKKINSDWRDEYDKKLSKFSFKLTEAAQDAMRSVKILQDIIAKETSAPIRDDENVYWRENRLSSVNKYEQEYYNENYCKPIVTEIANLVKYGARYNDKGEDIINSDNDVLKYLIAKSGLERNQSKREVEAMNARKPYEDQIKELQKQVEKEEIKEENANKKIAKLQEQADKAEMNKRVAVLHKDYSGLTELFQDEKDFDTLATSYVSDFEKKFDTESLWNAINRATKETLRKAFVDGLISRESYESTAKMYKYYIPLRGWANDVASEAYNYKGSGEGSRKILQTAKGRTSLADNPISEIGRMMQDAIFQGNRNRMKQAVYNLAMNHDTSLLNIKRQWYQNMGTEEDPAWERVFPDLNSDMTADQVAEEVEDFESRMRELKKEGKATQSRKGLILRLHTTKREEAQHRISVAINGKEYNIFVNGNPRAAQAINGELNDVDRYGSAVAKVNRFLPQVYTSINPEFVVTNYQRDAGFAASIVASTEPWSYQKEWAKNMTVYNPITTGVYLNRLIKKAKTGNINPSNKAERYMQEFLSHGGETGFTNMLSADDYKKQIKRDIKSINSVVSLSKASRAAVAFTERANTVFEDATRYATYVTSREQGRTIDRSIRDAKEISLNFNTRGADGLPGDGFIYRFFRGLRRWMIFVNPSIQGLNKAGMAFRNHPLRSSMMIAGLPTLLGYALPAIMQAVVGGGDGDDDDKNVVESYKDLPKWVRRTNIAIPIGGNNFVTIPLSYELRVSYGLGEMMWEYGEGMIDKDEIAIETLSQLSDLLPVSFANGTVAQSISPSIARPLIDIIQNRNFYGKKIYNDSQFIEGYPEYMKAYAGTPKWLVKSTEVLNNVIPNLNAGVSDKYTPGVINVNPAIIDYLLSSYLGGLYNFPSKFGKTISMIWDEDMRDIQNVPILSRNWKNSQSGNPYNSGDRYKTYMKEYDLSKQRFNGYKKEAKNDVPEFLNSLKDLLNTPSGKRMLMIDAYKRGGLDKLNQRIRDIDAYDNERYEGEKDALTKKRDEVKEELINKLDSISDGTLDFVNGEWVRK